MTEGKAPLQKMLPNLQAQPLPIQSLVHTRRGLQRPRDTLHKIAKGGVDCEEPFLHWACEVGHASGPDTCPSIGGASGFFLPESPWPDANPASHSLWLWKENH